ncbi:uncharacterized protein [Temnothorax longispinosus]
MAPTRKRSMLWNYFEKLNYSLVKCTTCQKEIKTPNPTRRTKIMRAHILNVHGISLDDETVTLPDDLKQYYSELPAYKAKCNNCGKAVSFLTNIENLRVHLRRHSIKIQSQDETVIMTPRRKRNKFWNYFEKLKPTLIKCTTCKKEIKVSHPKYCTTIMRVHLLKKHGISLDDDTHTLPDNLKQYYSELPGYKAKCNNCSKIMSFLTNKGYLRKHLKKHSTIIQSQDETIIMTPRRKRSKFWNYFEKLKPTLIKCTTCKKEIKVSHPNTCIIIMRVHLLKKHGISLDDDTHTLPDNLKQYYSELPGYKAKCNNCGETYSFIRNPTYLREHLKRRHSTRIQSQDETITPAPARRRNKLWNYFEELNPSLVKCTTCKKEIKIPERRKFMLIFRVHLVNVHRIYPDDDIYRLPDDLRQYYSELPGYKAKCNNCSKIMSFLTNKQYLRKHLKKHSTIIQSQDETVTISRKKRRKLWKYFEKLKPSLIKCVICKIEIYMPHPSNSTAITIEHLKRHGIFFNNDTFALPDDLRQYYSELPRYKAKCNDCGKTMSFLTNIVRLRKHLRRHSTRILSRDEPSTSSLADNSIDPSADRQRRGQTQESLSLPAQSAQSFEQMRKGTSALNKTVIMALKKKRSKLWNYFEELKPLLIKCTTCKKKIKISSPGHYTYVMRVHLNRHGIFLDNDTLPDNLKQYYSELPGYKAKCNNCGETVSFLTDYKNLRRHLRRHSTSIQSPDETIKKASIKRRSKLWNYFKELKPLLVKCTICKKEIKISRLSNRIKTFRAHLSIKHGIFLYNDTFTLPDDLSQYYLELSRYKAKCKDCDKTLSFLSGMEHLRKHLRKHSTRIQSRDEPSTSSLADDNDRNK